jgi:hypothetical protein
MMTRGPKMTRGATAPRKESWFARKDSNLDFQGQNLTCCHCTTGEYSLQFQVNWASHCTTRQGTLQYNWAREKSPNCAVSLATLPYHREI